MPNNNDYPQRPPYPGFERLNRPYYFSAYEIAVKHGFVGTEEEWIQATDEARILAQAAAEQAQQSETSAAQSAYEAGTAASEAAYSRGVAVNAAANAANSAALSEINRDAAAASAAAAAQSAAQSAAAAASTTDNRERAERAADNAHNSQLAADDAAARAAASASDAREAELGAEASAAAAAISETNAGDAAQTALTAAAQSTQGAESAQAAASAAAISEANAATSESKAAGSATSASASEASAANSAANAASSESNAASSEANSAISETNAAGSAANAAISETNAAYSAASAAASETNAAASSVASQAAATVAENSAVQATAAAGSAGDSATLSESWAVGGTGVRTGEDTNNAEYWASVAQGAAGGGVSTFNGRSGAVVPESGDYTAAQVGAIPSTDKGAANGIASLDGTGKVPAAQLPAMDYDPLGSAAAVQENLDTHANNRTNPHEVTAAQIGAIPSADKGEANGIATLDETGKVTAAQLPAMDYDPLGSAAAVQENLDTHAEQADAHKPEIDAAIAIHNTSDTAHSNILAEMNIIRESIPGDLYTQAETDQRIFDAVYAHDMDEAAHGGIQAGISALDSRVSNVEMIIGGGISTNPFSVTFATLTGVTVTGVWNNTQARVEF